MEGGLFGLKKSQMTYLYASQIVPTIIALYFTDILSIFIAIQVFYLLATVIYIKVISLQKTIDPYLFNQLAKLNNQIQKGISIGLSAFLLISIYGILILKFGKIALPESLQIGSGHRDYWFLMILIIFVNGLLQEWYWRLFLPKTFQSNSYKSHIINITYLSFHFALFSKYLGIWRAIPFVGSFFSVGNSMSHIRQKYGIVTGIITHFGITLGGMLLFGYIKFFSHIKV